MYRVLSTARTQVAVDPSFQAGFLGKTPERRSPPSDSKVDASLTLTAKSGYSRVPQVKGLVPRRCLQEVLWALRRNPVGGPCQQIFLGRGLWDFTALFPPWGGGTALGLPLLLG